MTREYDVVVIGTGTAGSSVAFACSCAGMSVAIADYRTFGGTCALRGCVPKKVLHAAAGVVEESRRLSGKGISGEIGIAWPDLMEYKRGFTDPVAENREIAYADAGIEMFHGIARFTGRNSLRVGEEEICGKHIVIATGSVPRPLSVPGEEHLATSDLFLDMPSLPGRIVFIGGGYISFELAHIAVRAGAAVTILHRSERMLRRYDSDLVDLLVEASGEAGISVQTNMPLYSIEQTAGGFLVRAGNNGEHSFPADLVVHGAGTVPEIGHLNLDAGGIETDSGNIVVDEYLRSASNQSV